MLPYLLKNQLLKKFEKPLVLAKLQRLLCPTPIIYHKNKSHEYLQVEFPVTPMKTWKLDSVCQLILEAVVAVCLQHVHFHFQHTPGVCNHLIYIFKRSLVVLAGMNCIFYLFGSRLICPARETHFFQPLGWHTSESAIISQRIGKSSFAILLSNYGNTWVPPTV